MTCAQGFLDPINKWLGQKPRSRESSKGGLILQIHSETPVRRVYTLGFRVLGLGLVCGSHVDSKHPV